MEREMGQLTKDDIPKLRNIPVVASDGEEIGHVGDAYYDEGSGRLECVGVAADAIGFSKRMIPVSGATIDEEGKLRLPYTKAQIEGAPDWDGDETESDDRWRETNAHYGGGVADEDMAVTRSEDVGQPRLRRWSDTEHGTHETVSEEVRTERADEDVDRR